MNLSIENDSKNNIDKFLISVLVGDESSLHYQMCRTFAEIEFPYAYTGNEIVVILDYHKVQPTELDNEQLHKRTRFDSFLISTIKFYAPPQPHRHELQLSAATYFDLSGRLFMILAKLHTMLPKLGIEATLDHNEMIYQCVIVKTHEFFTINVYHNTIDNHTIAFYRFASDHQRIWDIICEVKRMFDPRYVFEI